MIRTRDDAPMTKLLVGAAGLTLLAASAIHSGVNVPVGAMRVNDPFPGAAMPEAILGLTLLAGLAAVVVAPRARGALLAATLFATAGTIFGLSITVGSDRGGDITYHVVLLSSLLAAVVLLTAPDRAHARRTWIVLRAVTLLDGGLFLLAAAQNMGARIAIGPVDWYFAAPIVQAGIGEAVIGVVLAAAAIVMRKGFLSIAYGLSIFGITFGLLSQRVVGAPREIHALLVPIAVVGVMLLRFVDD